MQDLVTGTDILVKSKYLCGADGANSTIVRDLGLPMCAEPFQGLALNVFVEADMVRLELPFLLTQSPFFPNSPQTQNYLSIWWMES